MDLHKLAHEVYEATKHWHLPVCAGLISSVRLNPNINKDGKVSDFGNVPGDNILPREILTALTSRKSNL